MLWTILLIIAFFLCAIVTLFLINFYRDPKRVVPGGDCIVSPADGRIIRIIDTSGKRLRINKGLLGKVIASSVDVAKECRIISIFMSPLDVHINRAPIRGTVKSVRHTKGKFFRAYEFDKSLQNEKNEIVIENNRLRVKVIQVAGFLARRIRCWVSVNQKINKGGKIGMICLGSQTMLIIPKDAILRIRLNDRVKGGETIIADLR